MPGTCVRSAKLGASDASVALVFLYCLAAGTLSMTWGCGSSSPRRAGEGGGAPGAGAASGGVDGEGGGASVGDHGSEGGTFGQMAGAGGASAENGGGGGAAGNTGGAGGADAGGPCGDAIVCTVGNSRCVVNDFQLCALDQTGCPYWLSTRGQPSHPFPDCPLKQFICSAGIVIGCACPTSSTGSATDSCRTGSN